MGDKINQNSISQQIFNILDKNKDGRIDRGEASNDVARMFGIKNGDKYINDKKVNNFDNKASVFFYMVKKNNLEVINSDNNDIMYINGERNNAEIILPKNKSEVFTAKEQGFSKEAQFALMQKGLDPEALTKAGFTNFEQIVNSDNTTELVLKSNDGYNLKISDFQADGAKISRDANGNLVLDGVRGNLEIAANNTTPREVILSNIYEDNNDEPILNITNNSQAPITKTYPRDEKGQLSYDAAKALSEKGFPEGEAMYGGFTDVSITEDPVEGSRIHMTSTEHGFVLDADGNSPQPEDMSMHYDKIHHRLTVSQLARADIDITEDGAPEHQFWFSNVNQVHVENKTRKPVHIRQKVMNTEDGKKNDVSSFTYRTNTNFDTFQREYKETLETNIHSDGVFWSGTSKRHCSCDTRKSWSAPSQKSFGEIDMTIKWGDVTKEAPEVPLHPGRFYIQPSLKDYQKNDQYKMHEKNDRNISSVNMHDYLLTDQEAANSTNIEDVLSTNTKIGRSETSWGGINVQPVVVEDNSVTVQNSNGNKIIYINGNENNAYIGPAKNGHMSDEARSVLYENFHLKTKMLDEAGFTAVEFIPDDNGNVKDIVLSTKDGTKLTMPADEAYHFSEQMSITRNGKGEYVLSNLKGTLEGTGMKIYCPESNVDLKVIEHDAENGYAVFRKNDKDNKNGRQDAIHLNYSVPEGSYARIYREYDVKNDIGMKVTKRSQVQKHDKNKSVKQNKQYHQIEIMYIQGYNQGKTKVT